MVTCTPLRHSLTHKTLLRLRVYTSFPRDLYKFTAIPSRTPKFTVTYPTSHASLFESLEHRHQMVYCDRCRRWFRNNQALCQHEENSDAHWLCDDCGLDFESYDARRWHYMRSPSHDFCGDCDRHFISRLSRIQHMSAKHWYCRDHDKVIS
jgi:hypothetical protein